MKVKIKHGIPNGVINAPSSKSYAHRYLIASMLSSSSCTIDNVDLNQDIMATLDCCKAYGSSFSLSESSVHLYPSTSSINIPLFNCNESGSTLRFFIPLALIKYDSFIVMGTERLLARGLDIYEKIFIEQNIKFTKEERRIIISGKLKPGTFKVEGNLSSQFITGLLFALPLLNEDSVIEITTPLQSKMYVDMTIDVLHQFGIIIEKEENKYIVKGNQKYQGRDSSVEGDYSNASFFGAFNHLGGNIQINNLNPYSYQGDKVYEEYFSILEKPNQKVDISNCIDLGPVLMAYCAIKAGGTLTGTKRLRIKESDRGLAMKTELEKIGAQVTIYEDEIVIKKIKPTAPKIPFTSHNDHRIVMALSMFATLFNIEIDDYEAIDKSFPLYFEYLSKLGMEVDYAITQDE
ncbi:MAG: 3-phosphoshikimate 1-carboxyvinyltransferase [Bacilli bacterium]